MQLIHAKKVTVGGAPALKPARQVDSSEPIIVVGPGPKYVSRAGLKLEAALASFTIDPTGMTCLDAGSSTGGFTDCLLQSGAARVVAVDVGTGQLHHRLRKNPQVEVREQTDIRSITRESFAPEPVSDTGFDLVVADLSFISTRRLLSQLAPLVAPDGNAITLIKPQFEAGRRDVSRGKGIITDPEIWVRVVHDFIDEAAAVGLPVIDLALSPVKGGKGNVEFLALHQRADTPLGQAGETYLERDE